MGATCSRTEEALSAAIPDQAPRSRSIDALTVQLDALTVTPRAGGEVESYEAVKEERKQRVAEHEAAVEAAVHTHFNDRANATLETYKLLVETACLPSNAAVTTEQYRDLWEVALENTNGNNDEERARHLLDPKPFAKQYVGVLMPKMLKGVGRRARPDHRPYHKGLTEAEKARCAEETHAMLKNQKEELEGLMDLEE